MPSIKPLSNFPTYEDNQQWKKESCKGIGSWTEVRYCAESMINFTLLTLQLLNSLSTIHLNWYFLRMTQPWMLYSQIENSYFSFGWIWLLLTGWPPNQGIQGIQGKVREFTCCLKKKWKIVREKGIKMLQNQGKSIDWRKTFKNQGIYMS